MVLDREDEGSLKGGLSSEDEGSLKGGFRQGG